MNEKKESLTVIEVLQHSRHDWMNHIQLIKGFLSLGKIQEAERAIEQTVMQARQEAHVCSLPFPELAEMLVTFNWKKHLFRLDCEVVDRNIHIEAEEACLVQWLSFIFDALENGVEPYAENHLYLAIEEAEKGIRFFFEFSGIITEIEALNSQLEEALGASHVQRWKVHSYSAKEMQFEAII
ncbi:Spo0B C-terminal domain-containing protein [Bacillus thermotolerans]|uniref:Sporulation initiation phosphotransferase B (Spo0B) n=1 Tax=Bacillus thermotolerans TaxID=1221996 RepID=A0A0F5HNX9_BACTR|nr:Spo0B C-terminal domain-containing protein [Bacillus thermotolerans]KKB34532.1 Sporulation initiation phosphotransferase B (Spo0B) [Bacillus thermotolerans]KKB43416.1 Sporulation initiation phosphotransferase B (Spo0B) [Bacillus thermotolerans]KKB43463.1 Sporulation initiation phosphotransferase B (Spo0B) [Bacillus thermotolerans]